MENNQVPPQVNKRTHGPKKALLSQISIDSTEFLDNQTASISDSGRASPKHQRADSLSMISLPDDLRLSFSEIEDGSLQLEDLDDLTCMPTSGSGTLSNNLSTVADNKNDSDEIEATTISSVISSSSDKKRNLNSSENDTSSITESKPVVKSENVQDNSIYTWDDLMSWGTTSSAQQVSTVGSSGEVKPKKRAIPSRRSSKNKHMENVSCQVCGDVAAGFYCGAFICEACKKFYMRAYKQDKLKYVCLRDKKCVITKESRVQCQFCRFQKCVSLNMYIPKQGETESNKDMQMSEIPCRVCSAPSSGFHFGAITCEGCKGFFRRMAKEREPEKYQCNKKDNCEINMVTRNLCKACRYRACVRAGMSVEGSRIGRQPNSVKHAISMELKHHGKTEPGAVDAGYTKIKEEPIETSNSCTQDQENVEDFSVWQPNVPPSMNTLESRSYDMKKSSGVDVPQNKSALSGYQSEISDNDTRKSNDNIDIMTRASVTSASLPVNVPPLFKPSSMSFDFTSNSSSQFSVQNNQYEDNVSLVAQSVNVIQPHVRSQAGALSHTSIRNQSAISPGKSQSTFFSPVKNQSTVSPVKNQSTVSPAMNQSTISPAMNQSTISSGMNQSTISSAMNQSPISPELNQSTISPELNQSISYNQQGYRPMVSEPELNGFAHFSKPAPAKQNENLQKQLPSQERHGNEAGKPCAPIGRMFRNKSNEEMTELIRKTVDAGKCLQLLNYRVFDTDVNPTTSMNVDDIKAMFKSKYMDPRAGNHITSKVDMSVFSSRESTWNYMMTNFHHNTYITIRFAKLVPGFKTLSLNDQVKLIQSSIYPIELLNMSKVFDPATKKYNYFTYTKEEENIMMEQFPMLRVFQEHFIHVGEMVTSFQFTDEEFAILSALLLFPAEVIGLENPKAVESLQTEISSALQYYEEHTFPDGATRYGILLVRVAELVQCLLQHNLAIGLLLTHNPTIKVPQLFHELIIESIKEGQKT